MLSKSLVLRGAALLVGVLLAIGHGPRVAGAIHEAGHVVIWVDITDKGFNDQPSDFAIEVEQGQLVELTFVWAHQALMQEAHIIVLKGYGLETDQIDYYNRESTLKFVADKVGTFEFKCDLDCEVHSLLKSAQVKVKGSGGAPAAGGASSAIARTSLAFYPSAREVASEPVSLTATLRDAQGAPVSKAEVRFYVETEFAGTKGPMEIGMVKTDKEGVARLDYKPTWVGEHRVVARFEGMGLYAESEQALQLRVLSVDPAYTVAPIGLEPMGNWALLGLALVVSGVWSTFAYVLYNIYRIARA